MEKLIFSDTEYFYNKFKEIVSSSKWLSITTDFKSTAEIPERGRRLLRMEPGKLRLQSESMAGAALDKKYQVTIEHDIYKRIRIIVSL